MKHHGLVLVAFAVFAGSGLAACSSSTSTSIAPVVQPTPTFVAATGLVTFSGGVQLGNKIIDFAQSSGAYATAPNYGAFTIASVGNAGAEAGLVSAETGTIQSLTDATGAVTLPGPFMTFATGGSKYQLTATSVPAGGTGSPLTATTVGASTKLTFDVIVTATNTATGVSSGVYDVSFAIVYPGTLAQLEAALPYDGTYTAAINAEAEPQ